MWSKYIYIGLHVKYPLLLSYFNATWIFSTGFFFLPKNTQISNFMQIGLLGNESFDAHRQKDRRDEAISRLSQLCLVKDKCTLVQALRLCTSRSAHRGSRGIALLFLDHGTRRGWGISVTPRPLFTPAKDPVANIQEAGWAPGPVWTGAENLAPTGIRSPNRPTRSQSLLSYLVLAIVLKRKHHSVKYKWLEPVLTAVTFSLGMDRLNACVPVQVGVR